jgi:photosystem II stability/assembly factor-like uncharacterized protein
MRTIFKIFQNEGYGIGSNFIYKTINGGTTWLKVCEVNTRILSSITKTPNGKIFLVGNDRIILKKE